MNAAAPALSGGTRWTKVKQLWRDVRTYLINASNKKLLVEGPGEIQQYCRFFEDKTGKIPNATHSVAYGRGVNFDRDPTWPHLTRKEDQAWFDFQLSVKETNQGLDILAYDFELRFKDKAPMEFVRLDLNHPNHHNTDEGLRSHMHLASDDDGFVVPSVILDPFELLDVMLHGATRVGRKRMPPVAHSPTPPVSLPVAAATPLVLLATEPSGAGATSGADPSSSTPS